MTGDQSRLQVGDRVCRKASATDQGAVIGPSWSEVTIDWENGFEDFGVEFIPAKSGKGGKQRL